MYHYWRKFWRVLSSTVLKDRISKVPGASIKMLEKVFSRFDSDQEMQLINFALAPLYSETYNADQGLSSCLKTKYRAKSHNDLYSEEEKYFDYTSQLKLFKKPTLIIVGEKDWICPPSQSKKIHDLVDNSKLVVVPNANHSAHLEYPDFVLDKVIVFLRT
ncbi:unnamed protein product [Ambrosiozyma monospora]|uniref:Unnamed protein product n=1 Tax=Ambrosiozyma monospora TaxID=43982 RepID=A0ACB5UCF1_AMBMO|nr:unnamed protein product [Ambrosiozyma monospora]